MSRMSCSVNTPPVGFCGELRMMSLVRSVMASASSFTSSRKDRKSTRLNSSHSQISYAVFCLKKKNNTDLEIARGYAGFRGTLGHEVVGVAVSAPGAPEVARRRVVGEINAGGGGGALLRAGAPQVQASSDVRVEASGSRAGFETALRLLRPRGTLVLNSNFHAVTELNAAPVVVDDISIVGFFFFNDAAPPELYPLPPHDALPI